MKYNKYSITFGRYIREAREEVNMTINDLAFEMVKDKENTKEIKKMEKLISSWENEKAYPTLDDIYKMAYIININPGELLTLRNRGRKQFYRESNDPPSKRHDWIEISENTSLIFSGVGRLLATFALIALVVVGYKFLDTFYGNTGAAIELEVIDRQIQKNTDPENMTNDGTVANMLRRKQKENLDKSSGQDITNTTIEEYDLENEFEDVLNEAKNILEN